MEGNVRQQVMYKSDGYYEWITDNFLQFESSGWSCSQMIPSLGCIWCLKVMGAVIDNHGTFRLCLEKQDTEPSEKKVTFTFGMKKPNGTLIEDEPKTHIFKNGAKGNLEMGISENITVDTKQLTSWKILIFTCRMRDPSEVVELESLSMDFKALFKSKAKYDVIINVKGREYKAHKAVLGARSPVFAAMFEHRTKEEMLNTVTVVDCDSDSFAYFLEYLYTGIMQKMTFTICYHLFFTSDKYDVPRLKSSCRSYMIANLTTNNVDDVTNLAVQHEDAELKSSCKKFKQNLSQVGSTTEKTSSAKKSSLGEGVSKKSSYYESYCSCQ